ncbi:Membrane-bound lysozyme inhibitor of C-type lysozyme precursor [Roseovarius albus]|uniref:Membrane-bound lysozyme inhibitor of C-type lysozyme n=1 Tax=Roseovarius albus TaxID=1247867 RepID=A0A1X6Y6D6_9RHOB|nr:MliC family protein [Roseovarius albus]SLN12011.1 Membrane-bound lysozyme inhibitor of C-type lysozyme precursor [Roseovarius albus]
MSYRLSLATLVFVASAGSSAAEATLAVSLNLGKDSSFNSTEYKCENNTSLSVKYVNAGVNSLAIMPIEDENRIFAAVIAGSGVRYMSGPYTWWIKGKNAMLENVMDDGEPVNCAAKD